MPFDGGSQKQVLSLLLENKSGMTIDELVEEVGLSRSGVNQHLMALEREGYVQRATARKTGGRPVHVYVLTQSGANLFPKKYSWFSLLLMKTLRDQMGQEQLSRYMYDLGIQTSAACIPRLVGKNRAERVAEIVAIMNETGFAAQIVPGEETEKIPRIQCKNCVYHDLSKDYPEVCRFDIGFLSGLMGAEVEHQACMQRGSDACRFRFNPPA